MTGHLVAACNLVLALLQASATKGTLRLYAVGDINLGRRTARERLIEGDTLYSFRPLLDTLRGADITFGNLESPIAADTGAVDDSGAVFTAPPLAALALALAGFDIVSTANNHAWDGGEGTLQEAMRQLTRARGLVVGSAFGRDTAEQAVVVRRPGCSPTPRRCFSPCCAKKTSRSCSRSGTSSFCRASRGRGSRQS